MADTVDTLLVDVRANTQGFAADVAQMRGTFDATLVDGFANAGNVLERGLLSAIRKGSLGFDDLRRVALAVLADIAAQAVQGLFGGSGSDGGGLAGLFNLGSIFGKLLGLPGRATGGSVAPDRPYLVGERGPELFVPTSAGRIDNGMGSGSRDIRIAINVNSPSAPAATQALQRSSRQVAAAVRRALNDF